MIIESKMIHFLYFGLRCIRRGTARRIYAIEFRPSVKTFPTSKISLEYDLPMMPKDVESMMLSIYRIAIKAMAFNSFLYLLIELIERNEMGKIKTHIYVAARFESE